MTEQIDAITPNPVQPDPPAGDPVAELDLEPASRFGLFLRQGYRFAIPIDCVVEVLPGQSLTRVPRARPEVAGLLNLRGEILTVLLVDNWLQIRVILPDPSKPILVLSQQESLFGIEVDRVEGVLAIPDREIQAQALDSLPAPHASCAGWWHPAEQPPCTVLAEDAFRDLVCPLDVSGDP